MLNFFTQRCLPQWRDIIKNYNAMEIVGGFLGDLLHTHTPPRRSTKAVSQPSSVMQFPGMPDANQFLHHAPKYTQSQLVRLIVNIYGGVPESFEVFHCRPSSTQEELSLFLERVERKPLRYLILEVNKLPFGLQEVRYCRVGVLVLMIDILYLELKLMCMMCIKSYVVGRGSVKSLVITGIAGSLQ